MVKKTVTKKKAVAKKAATAAKKPVVKKESVSKPTVKSQAGLTIPVYDLQGKQTSSLSLTKEIFSTQASDALLAQYVRVHLANRRQGNAASKTRAQVRGSTRKIYRQKGTGRARHGAKSAPIFVGGGTAFGPHPRDHSLKLNKKQKKKAFFYALSLQQKEGNIVGLTDKSLEIVPKTKNFVSFLKATKFNDMKILLVLPEAKRNNLSLASRNVPSVTLTNARSINAFDVLNSEKIVFVAKALPVLTDHFLNKHEN